MYSGTLRCGCSRVATAVCSQGKKAEARQILGEIYGWFTEGVDTKDLQEATAPLKECI
jgi:hypothetical protein